MISNQSGNIFRITNKIYCCRDRNSFIIFLNNKKQNESVQISKDKTRFKWNHSTLLLENINSFNKSNSKNRMCLNKKLLDDGLFIRNWKNGDRIISYKSKKTKKLSDLFINNKISIYKKNHHPVIVNREDNIVWVPEILHASTKVNSNNKLIQLKWIPN